MSGALRQITALAGACGLTWWVLFRAPVPPILADESQTPTARPPVELRPIVEEVVAVKSATAPPGAIEAVSAEPPADAEPQDDERAAPPPSEAGSRTGTEEGEIAAAPEAAEAVAEAEPDVVTPPDPPEAVDGPSPRSVAELAADAELLEIADSELRGEAAVGFSTVFVSSPEEQLAIASAFGEDVVLVPREALDPDRSDARSYRLNLERGVRRARVESLPGRPALERYRQYRDLFAYDFARLPEPLRELRKAVVRRDRVYLFAALIPPSEWAIVVGRRREALATLQLDESDVERFVMRYVADPSSRRSPSPQYDIRVDEIVLADGTRHRPQL